MLFCIVGNSHHLTGRRKRQAAFFKICNNFVRTFNRPWSFFFIRDLIEIEMESRWQLVLFHFKESIIDEAHQRVQGVLATPAPGAGRK